MIPKLIKFVAVVLVWYMYFSFVAQALATQSISIFIVSILWLFAVLMVFPIFKGGGI